MNIHILRLYLNYIRLCLLYLLTILNYIETSYNVYTTMYKCILYRLFYTFHDEEYLYMCMELAPGGELSKLIKTYRNNNIEKGIHISYLYLY